MGLILEILRKYSNCFMDWYREHHLWNCPTWMVQNPIDGVSTLVHVIPDSKVHGANMGPIWGRPRWAPCWPHEPCYLGCLGTDRQQYIYVCVYVFIYIHIMYTYYVLSIYFTFLQKLLNKGYWYKPLFTRLHNLLHLVKYWCSDERLYMLLTHLGWICKWNPY